MCLQLNQGLLSKAYVPFRGGEMGLPVRGVLATV